MLRSGRVLATILVLTIAACSGQAVVPTTSPPPETTTTAFPNPFLELTTEVSNFSSGEVVTVVGLDYSERNWTLSFPSGEHTFATGVWEFDRLQAGLIASGEAASYDGGPIWERFEEGDLYGFFPQANTGVVGPAVDITSEFTGLESETVDELANMIVAAIGENLGLTPVQITRREYGGREITFDLVGASDPASRGYRIRVVAIESGEMFGVATVEQSILCGSGIDESGGCT